MVSPGNERCEERKAPRSSTEDRAGNSPHPFPCRRHAGDIAAQRVEFEGGCAGPLRRRAILIVIPAKAGIHASAVSGAAQWIPAFAGLTISLMSEPARISRALAASAAIWAFSA